MARLKTTTKKETLDKIECLKCGKEKAPNTQNFYANSNPLLSSEKFEVCKECINEFIGEKETRGYLDRIKLVLAMLDKPFISEQWLLRECDWAKYIPQISSFPQYRSMSFKDSTYKQENNTTDRQHAVSQEEGKYSSLTFTNEEIHQLSLFWGKGLQDDELEYLQNEFEKLTNSYECDSYAMEMLFQEAAQQRLTIKKLRADSKSVDKELKTLQDLLGSANIKPVQETGANATEQATFGTLIKKYENERPIPEPDPAWQDVDEVKKYVQVWFLGHLCKMLGINNDYSRMYEEEVAKHTVDNPTYENDEDDEDGEIK